MKVEWIRQTHQYSNGYWAKVGKVTVGHSGYFSGTRGETKNYGCECLLPGIKKSTERYATVDEAKDRLERMVSAWFKWTQEAP